MTDAIRTKKRWDEEEEAKRRRNIGDCKEEKGSRGSRDLKTGGIRDWEEETCIS